MSENFLKVDQVLKMLSKLESCEKDNFKKVRETLYKELPEGLKPEFLEISREFLKTDLELMLKKYTKEEIILFEKMLKNEISCMHNE